MEIIIADECGFCYGVKRAVQIAEDSVKGYNNNIATLGEIIHNPSVVHNLADKGVQCKHALSDFNPGETVIIRSHGVGPTIYEQAKAQGLTILDATCPHVMRAQRVAEKFAREGKQVLIIGEKKHPEVLSVQAWAPDNAVIIETAEDLPAVPEHADYGVLCQTTFEQAKFEHLVGLLQKQHPTAAFTVEKTICTATAERQAAAKKLALATDVVFVFGGYHSANTRHLAEIVSELNPHVYHLETPAEITWAMLEGHTKIGITAGASTPDYIIKEAVYKMETMESLLGEETVKLHIGMVVEATVVAVTKEEIIVNFGYQSEGSVAFDQWVIGGTKETVAPTVHEGDKVTLKVVASENRDGLVVMSKVAAEADKVWTELPAMIEANNVFTVKGLKKVKGGLTVATAGVTGFIPASHLALKRVEDLGVYEGKEFQAEVLECVPEKKRLVLSARELLKKERAASNKAYREEREAKAQERTAQEEAGLNSLVVGSTVKGIVKNVVDFGMFVEVAPFVQGLVHVSEMSWERGVKSADLYKSGDEVEVMVKDIDVATKRVGLSIKALQENPWVAATAAFHEGDVVNATILRFLPFGAIASLSDKVEGMIHVSEIADEKVEKPEDKLEVGQTVSVKILHIDREHRKLALSLKAVAADAEKEEMSKFINTSSELSHDLSDKLPQE